MDVGRRLWRRLGVLLVLTVVSLIGGAPVARALPSYALQTGQQCVACHNGYPELTPYGRQFKLNGYALGNGSIWEPPVAALIISTFTHTDKAQSAPAVPGTSRNDNAEMDAANLYLAGKLFPDIGAFIQGLYSPLTHRFQLFTTDIRFAKSAHWFGKDTTYGISVNNNPGMTDPWNTGQSFWSYPYENTHVVAPPIASTAIQGRYMNQVVGANAYASWNQRVYADVGLYSSIDAATLNSLGVDPRGSSAIDGAAPYWRLAFEPAWGHSTLEMGTFGMTMAVDPHRVTSAGTDRTTDVGFDTEYQYLANRFSLSLMGSYIFEDSSLDASRALGFASNASDSLKALNLKATYYYDQTYGANVGYFQTTGSRDRALYGASSIYDSPDTAGWILEVDYYPFNRDGPVIGRKVNFKVGLQYTYYTRFDGGTVNYNGFGRNAADNNTLFLYLWTAF